MVLGKDGNRTFFISIEAYIKAMSTEAYISIHDSAKM